MFEGPDSFRFVAAAFAASDDCIKVIAIDGSLQFMTEGGQRIMEVDDFSAIKGCYWPDFWQGIGNKDAIAAIDEARAGRAARFTGYANTAKGNERYWDVKVSPIFNEQGAVESILSISRDITALKAFEDEQILLRNELAHRIKNILALVQAVASQTLKDDADMATAKPTFLSRLGALSRGHEILINAQHSSTQMSMLADAVVQDHGTDRVAVDGPEINLSAKCALALTLAFHELATNALKYGALSRETGRVSLTWTISSETGEPMLHLTWRETGGPEVSAPSHKGFGSRMIEKALSSYLGGTSCIDYRKDGLVFSISAPVVNLTEN
ncbi:HWE histidine kinase domain-containing protein [uncultured Agrobacterium sp.]|uniref:sensor histidine kinase n=1 Tax=uncultured Agrobacterium sp. TaxID=157277 RepID=UPI0025E9A386|nr:HWE histidine kinase domain-containing protein [uncultured Agrobacterium sp.]